MDAEDWLIIILVSFVSLFVAVGIPLIVHNENTYAIAGEDALEICLEREYDYAESYSTVIFGTEALNVKCGIIDYSQKQVKINSENSIPVVIS